MSNPIIYKGQTFEGTISLKQDDGVDPDNIFPYPIQVGSVVEVLFPGTSLSTANSGEVTPDVDADTNGIFTFKGSPTKSALLTVGTNKSVDVRVTEPDGDVRSFEKQKIIDIKALDNA